MSHDNEAFFFLGMVWVWNHKRIFVIKHRFGLLKRDSVFYGIACLLSRIPLEGELVKESSFMHGSIQHIAKICKLCF